MSMRLFGSVMICLMIVAICVGCGGSEENRLILPTITLAPAPTTIPNPVLTVMPSIVPTMALSSSSTPDPTLPPMSDAGEIVRKWQAAADGIHTLRVTQSFMLIKADGSRSSIPDSWGGPRTTDEVLEFIPGMYGRYKFVEHIREGDYTELYGGERTYRYRSWTNELYYPGYDEVHVPGERSDPDPWKRIEDISTRSRGMGPEVDYKLIGRSNIEGHSLVELIVTADAPDSVSLVRAMAGDRVYIDEATYLPYRMTYKKGLSRMSSYSDEYGAFEVTFKDVEINGGVTSADFSPPSRQDTIKVTYSVLGWAPEQAYEQISKQGYSSTAQAAKALNFQLFEPQGGVKPVQGRALPGDVVNTLYTVEKNGSKSSVVAINTDKWEILEGTYIPAAVTEIFAIHLFIDRSSPDKASTVNITGQPATLQEYGGGDFGHLLLTRYGTQILIRRQGYEGSKEEAIELARNLQPVQKAP